MGQWVNERMNVTHCLSSPWHGFNLWAWWGISTDYPLVDHMCIGLRDWTVLLKWGPAMGIRMSFIQTPNISSCLFCRSTIPVGNHQSINRRVQQFTE